MGVSPEEERELGSEGTEVLLVEQSLAPFKRPHSLFSQSRSQPSGLECKTQDRVAGLCRERLRGRCQVLVLKVALQMLLLVILRAPGAPDAKTLPGGLRAVRGRPAAL